ncbi:type 2 lanthipeptide synthetase LanM family protein [Longimicrobium sp.]|uniref:type 2 lanthipeptide synthetase LanM family protein n=1 Tax=Longimicrobium sp. TaxID=2029185 RepID=UPI002F945F89
MRNPTLIDAIIANGAGLQERLTAGVTVDQRRFVPSFELQQVERWKTLLGESHPEALERRLTAAGIRYAPAELASRIGPLKALAGRPEWLDAFLEIHAALKAAADTPRFDPPAGPWRFVRASDPLPFQHLLAPVVVLASRDLHARRPWAGSLLAEAAVAEVERGLLQTLVYLFSRSLQSDFSYFRGGDPVSWRGVDAEGDELYREFCHHLLAHGLDDFFATRPVLARLLVCAVQTWSGATARLLDRLRADLALLETEFGGGRPLGRVVEFAGKLSDRHDGGDSVAVLGFASGQRIVYKPRDLRIEQWFNALLAGLNGTGSMPRLRTLRVCVRERYGWTEFVEPLPCADAGGIVAFYERAGALLCLAYVLGGTDLHAENLMASGADPVLVDVEMLFQPECEFAPLLPAAESAQEDHPVWPPTQVYATGLLPIGSLQGHGTVDLSGLGATPGQSTGRTLPAFGQVNRSGMCLLDEEVRTPGLPNRPACGGVHAGVRDHADAVARGFAAAWGTVIRHRVEVLERVEQCVALPIRVVFRPTRHYSDLRFEAVSPGAVRSGTAHDLVYERLYAAALDGPARQPLVRLAASEVRTLRRLDIPRFTTAADATWVELDDGVRIEGCLSRSGYARVVERVRTMDLGSLDVHLQLIGLALATDDGPRPAAPAGTGGRAEAHDPLGADDAVAAAAGIVAYLRRKALYRGKDVLWLGVRGMHESATPHLRPLRFDLYSGSVGVALFLAAFARVTGDPEARRMALGALSELRCALRRPGDSPLARYDVGGASGLGSVAYGLLRCGTLLNDGGIVEDAGRAARLITPERVAADEVLDVMRGAAGGLLGILAVHEAAPEPALVDNALACARHLVHTRVESGDGACAWRTIRRERRSGLSHGAAGIAYALMRVHHHFPGEGFGRVAREAVAFENTLYDPDAGDWRALLPEDADGNARRSMCTWCNGAAGIGLARLLGDAPATRDDVDRALRATLRSLGTGADFVCCGETGRVELLLEAAERLDLPEQAFVARRHLAWMVGRAAGSGGFHLGTGRSGGNQDVGLFTGLAGIGYQLLRSTHPGQVPPFLGWR